MPPKAQHKIHRSVTHHKQASSAIAELASQLQGQDSSIVVLFVSPHYDTKQLAEAIPKHFPEQLVIGCSTAGEIGPSGYLEGSISAFSLPKNEFQAKVTLFDNLSEVDLKQAEQLSQQAKIQFEKEIKQTCAADNTFALLLSDGLSLQEEVLVAGIDQGLSNIPLIGGSAGDGIDFKKTWLYYQGEALNNRALLLLIHSQRRFKAFKTEHFTQVGSSHVVTDADPKNRIVWEIDAEPAAEFYARSVGLQVDQLSPNIFADHPLVVKVGNQIYVRSVQQVIEGRGLLFYCAIESGIVLHQALKGDLLENLNNALDNVQNNLQQADLIIGFDCILRQLEAKTNGTLANIGQSLLQNNVVGFSTYGEQMGGQHINQTFTALAIAAGETP